MKALINLEPDGSARSRCAAKENLKVTNYYAAFCSWSNKGEICSVNFVFLGRSYLVVVVVVNKQRESNTFTLPQESGVIAGIISTKRHFAYIVVEYYWSKARRK